MWLKAPVVEVDKDSNEAKHWRRQGQPQVDAAIWERNNL
jgi:hypothetical protein